MYSKIKNGLMTSIALSIALPAVALEAPNKTISTTVKSPTKDKNWQVKKPNFSVKATKATLDVTEGTWMSLDVSPDGKMIAFDLLGDIYLMPIEGGKARNISSGMQWDMQPRFSPDGKRIAFTSDRAGGDNIWTMNLEGKNLYQITKEKFTLLNNPTWSKDGNYIAARKHFTTSRSLGTGEIWMYHIEGGNGLPVVKRPNKAYQKELGEPMFSADGEKIYYTQNVTSGNRFIYSQDTNKEIFNIKAVDLSTGDIETVAGGAGGAVRATPSPDGKYLAFIRRVRADSRLFIRDLETGEERMIHDTMDQDMQETWAVQGVYPNMDWTPDGQSLIFWAKGKIQRINVVSGVVKTIPFRVKDERTLYPAPQYKVDVAPESFKTKMVRFATPSPDGRYVVFESLGKLWLQGPDGKTKRLTKDKGTHHEMHPVWSNDGAAVYFSTWDDTDLGQIRGIKARGGKSKILSKKAGRYADLSVSKDGKTLYFKKQGRSALLTAAGTLNSGLYSMAAKGGEMTKIISSGSHPHEGPNGRVYFTSRGHLKSVTKGGFDIRTHASAQYANRFILSPDGTHVSWIANYHTYVAPLPKTGAKITLGTQTSGIPIARISKDGALYQGWDSSGKKIHWSIGATLKSAKVEEAFKKDFIAPSDGRDLSMQVTTDKPSTLLAIKGARLITMDATKSVIEDGTVLVQGNRIVAIGETGSIEIPAGAKTVDARGKTIIPGIIDIHAHGPYGTGDTIPQQNWDVQGHLALGVTTVHNPSSVAKLAFAAAEYQKAGQIVAPRIYSTAEIIYGAKSSYWVNINGMEDALAAVRRLKAQGAISVKNYNQPRRNQRQQVVEAARREGMMVVAEGGSLYHMDMNMIADGNTGIEHNIPVQDAYEDVYQYWSQSNVGYTPTVNVGFGAMQGETYFYQHSDVWKHPILSNFVPPKMLQAASVRRLAGPDSDYGFFQQVKVAKELMKRGVTVNIGAHGQREGLGSHWDMWQYKLGGMTEMEVLQTATINPARYMGMEDDLGSLEKGKLADLLILDANPLEDIFNTDNIHRIMLNGRLYDTNLNETITGNHKQRPFYWQGKAESEIR
ncbi:amidohydrolase family protein [Temperatibacter marinus]|uniref:Amidohydrolase family protein n=1 Tax=Temperatibacter marinus TaxID=1456591 RepID=A0AA52EFN7_9PROT|nr:amidohydrolase family protein [Temperatibacter marinus]WND02818.1 amidohydrolase family protein [Temperatibacter marinus]